MHRKVLETAQHIATQFHDRVASPRRRRPYAMKKLVVGAITVLATSLAILAIASTARSRSPDADAHADPAAALNVRAQVPEQVMSTIRGACFDCHSNETRWPWYSALPFASRRIERDVSEGRGQVNFSRWGQYNPFDRADMLDRACELAASHTMPPLPYRLLHSAARLSETEVTSLCAWSRKEATRLVQGGP
jgi:hypothetical protein